MVRATVALAALPLAAGCAAPPGTGEGSGLERFAFERPAMGTSFRIVLYASDRALAAGAAEEAFARIAELERVFSDYDPESEAMRLARRPGEAVAVSPDLLRVVARAEDLHRLTGGAFDVTVGPLTRLWREAGRSGELPEQERLAEARAAVGFEKVAIDEDAGTVTLAAAGMVLDFGGIAKGDALDEALAALARSGIERALVDGGGDLALGAPPPGREGWRIEVEGPRGGREGGARLVLARAGVATSGDAYRAVEIGGRRYSHVVDPRSGEPLGTPISVTVVAQDAATADALATALSVLGAAEGLELAERVGAAARVARVVDGRVGFETSAGWCGR